LSSRPRHPQRVPQISWHFWSSDSDTKAIGVFTKISLKNQVDDLLTQLRAFHEEGAGVLLFRNVRIEEDLVDQLFNSSEKRLARILLLLTRFGKDGQHEPVVPRISQEALAEMVGTTRSRVSFFMNKFRKLGFIEYNGGLNVHSSLLNIVLHD